MSLKKTASKKKDDVDDGTPRWMDSDYDESHKAEIEPLFGTGKVALQGEGDEEGDIESKSVNVSYGSVAPSSEDDDSDDDDDDDEEEMVVEEKPKVLLKSVAKPTTNTASRKLRNLLTATKSKTSSSTTKTKKKVREIVITERGKPEMPRPSCLVACFKFIEGFCIIVCMGLLASQIIPFFFIPLEELGLANACLKFYISLFCILFALVEGNVPIGPIRDASFLQTYFSRGFLYSFIGLSALEEAYSERVEDMIAHAKDEFRVSWISLFMQLSAWALLIIGGLYMIFGLCCLNGLRNRVYRIHKEKWDTYREAMRIYRQENP